jgi:hypothetical protein
LPTVIGTVPPLHEQAVHPPASHEHLTRPGLWRDIRRETVIALRQAF